MTDQHAQHPARVPPDRLQAAREKAKEKPKIDSGRSRFTVTGPHNLEPLTEFLQRIVFDTTAPCDMQVGMAYRAADFHVPGSVERRCWIFIPDHKEDEPEVAYYCDRLNLLPAQECTHKDFLEGKYQDADKCPECDEEGMVYPRTFQEEIQMGHAAEAAREKAKHRLRA